MSRSQPALQNPAVRFFDYSPKQGTVRYFDKTLGEKGENVNVPMPFKFLVLDQLSQIGGGKKIGFGTDKKFVGYFSNAVRRFDINKATFTLRDKNGIVAEGGYKKIKGKVSGAKLLAGIYIAFYDDDKNLQIGHLKLHGSAMGAWFEFGKKQNVETGVVMIDRGEETEDEDGRKYYLPDFSHSPKISLETDAAAVELDKVLQTYLTAYFQKKDETTQEEEYSGPHGDAYEEPEFAPRREYGDDDAPAQNDEIPW